MSTKPIIKRIEAAKQNGKLVRSLKTKSSFTDEEVFAAIEFFESLAAFDEDGIIAHSARQQAKGWKAMARNRGFEIY